MGKEKSFFGKATNFAISVGSSVVNTASSAGTGAYNLAKSAIDTGKADIELWNKSKEQHKLNQERLEKIKGEYDVSYALLEEAGRLVDVIRKSIQEEYTKIDNTMHMEMQVGRVLEREDTAVDEVDGKGILGTSVLAGGVVAGSVTALVASFATAGTGAAISSLNGMYAVNATLAALGGGTVASGGLGILGGAAVASFLLVAPAAIVGSILADKGIKKFVKSVDDETEATNKAVKIYEDGIERNAKFRALLNRIHDCGVLILFFLKVLSQRVVNAPDNAKADVAKIVDATKSKLVQSFIGLKLLSEDETSVDESVDSIVTEIEEDCQLLQQATVMPKKRLYTSKEMNDVFQKIYSDAEEYIYMSYPWYNDFCVKTDSSLMQEAINRGVKLVFFYGFGDDNKKRSNEDSQRAERTKEAIALLKQKLNPKYVEFRHVDSHQKIAICDKYALHGSQNMMTYRYNERFKDKRAEATIRIDDEDLREEFINMLFGNKVVHK